MCNVCKDTECHWGEYCYPSGVSFNRPPETSEVPTKWRRGDRIVRDGKLLEFIEAEIEGEKWAVIGPAPLQ